MSDPYGGSTVREWDWVRLVSPHCAIDAGKAWRPAPLSENGIGLVWYRRTALLTRGRLGGPPHCPKMGLGSFGIARCAMSGTRNTAGKDRRRYRWDWVRLANSQCAIGA